MKVVITEPWGDRLGGAENMLWTFLKHVDRSEVEPVVVFLQGGSFEQEVSALGIRTHVLPAGKLREIGRGLSVIRSLARILRSERPALLLNWMAKTHLYGAPASVLSGANDRVVWWQHSVPERHWLDRLATRLPAKAIGCSSRASAEAQQRLRPFRPTFVVRPGIEVPRVTKEEALAVRRQLGIPKDKLIVGIVGRLQPWKGHDHFIRALGELHKRGHKAHGLIVGGNAWDLAPGYERLLHELVEQIGLTGAVAFTGQVADATAYIRAMDVFVSASAPEPFGIALLEAMALSVPVVAINAGGPAEIIEPQASGILVTSNDPKVLADAVDPVLTDEKLRRRLAEGGRRRFLQAFEARRMTEELVSVLRELAGSNDQPPAPISERRIP